MCGQGQGVSEGARRGSSRWARAAAPGRRKLKAPGGQCGLLAWLTVAAGVGHALLPSKSLSALLCPGAAVPAVWVSWPLCQGEENWA